MRDWLFKNHSSGATKSNSKPDPFFNLLRGHFTQDEIDDLKVVQYFNQTRGQRIPNIYFQPNGIPIGFDTTTGQIIYLPPDHPKRHIATDGKTRTGKTTTTNHLIMDRLYRNDSSLVVIDQGDLVPNLITQVNSRLEDIVLVRISDTDYPAGINLLQMANFQREIVTGEIIRLINRISPSERLPNRMTMLTRRTLWALLHWPETTLADLESFLFDQRFRERILSKVDDPELKYFWKERYPRDEKIFRSSAEGIITRLEAIIGDPAARNLLCQKETKIPINGLVNGPRKWVLLLDLNTRGKVSPLVGEVIARVFLIIIHNQALSRPLNNKKPIFLLLDEVQTFLEPFSLSEILARGAKYEVFMTCAFQYLGQIGDFWAAIEGNVGTLLCFNLGADDARRMAKSFPGIDYQEFIELPRFHMIARVNDDEGTHCFKVRTFPPNAPGRSFRDEIIRNSRERFARPRAEVEADFRRHREMVLQAEQEAVNEPDEFTEELDPII